MYLLPYSYNVTVYKDQNQNLVCYWICEGAKLSFSFKAKFFFVCYHGNEQYTERTEHRFTVFG